MQGGPQNCTDISKQAGDEDELYGKRTPGHIPGDPVFTSCPFTSFDERNR